VGRGFVGYGKPGTEVPGYFQSSRWDEETKMPLRMRGTAFQTAAVKASMRGYGGRLLVHAKGLRANPDNELSGLPELHRRGGGSAAPAQAAI
jgi:hypothetical protein